MRKITLLLCLCISVLSYAGINSLSEDSPTVISFTPTNYATGIAVDTEVKVEFDRNVTLKPDAAIQFVNTRTSSPVTFTAATEGVFLKLNYEGTLDYNTMYFVNVTNSVEGFSAMTSWMFTTGADPDAVTVAGYTPEADATDVPANTEIKVKFSKEITLHEQANAKLSDMTSFGTTPDVTVSVDGEYMTLSYEGSLKYKTKYMVEVYNPTEEYTSTIRWFFTTGEEALAVVSHTPANYATDIAIDTEVKVEFNKDVTLKPDAGIQFINTRTSAPVAFTAVTDGVFLKLNYEGTLDYNTMYFVNVTNSVEGFDTMTSWMFTTEADPDAVTVVAYTPEADATDVPADTEIKVQFSKEVTLHEQANAKLSDMTSFGTTPDVTVSVDGEYMTLSYEGSLEYKTRYMVEVYNPTEEYTSTIRWFFTTGEEALAVVSHTPANYATDIAIDTEVKVEFNKDVTLKPDAGIQFINTRTSVPVAYTAVTDGVFLKLNYEGTLDYNTMYFVNVTNSVEGFDTMTSWMFTTEADPDAVTVVAYTPEADATDIPTDTEIKVQFSKEVTLHEQANAKLSDMTSFETAPDVTVSVDGEYLILNYEGMLNGETKYMVEVYNPVEGYEATIRWFFTTGEEMAQPIEIVALSPADGATDVLKDAEVKIEFNRDVVVNPRMNFIFLFDMTNEDEPVAIQTGYAEDGKFLTIKHDGLEYDTPYKVEIAVGSIIDYSETITWTFTTITNPNGIDNVAAGISIYPNPTADFIYIKSPGETLTAIYNLQGVRLIQTTKKEIDMSSFENGVYVIDVNNIKTKVVKK